MNRVVLYKIVDEDYEYLSATPKEAMVLCLKGEWQQVLSSPLVSYYYAKKVIKKGRWSEAEAVIAADPYWAYAYARDVIGGRWPEGEAMIASDPYWAYAYARQVIKGRWPEAEDTIEQSSRHWKLYAEEHGLATKESVV